MRVQVKFRIIVAIGGPLMKTHGVRKRSVKQIVVTNRGLPEYLGQSSALLVCQFDREPTRLRRLTSSVSKGQTAQNGTSNTKWSLAHTNRACFFSSRSR